MVKTRFGFPVSRPCTEPEQGPTIARNNIIFTDTMTDLMEILSSKLPDRVTGGLTLELGIYSPSDTEHHFWPFPLLEDYPFQTEEDLEKRPSLNFYHRRKIFRTPRTVVTHRQAYDEAGQHKALSSGKYRRLLGAPLELRPRELKEPLPVLAAAPIVKELLLRRQFYRSLAITTLAALFQQSLTGLECFRYERRMGVVEDEEQAFWDGFKQVLLPAFPSTLRRFYFDLHEIEHSTHLWAYDIPENREFLGHLMAASSHGLTEFFGHDQLDITSFLRLSSNVTAARWRDMRLLCLRSDKVTQKDLTEMLILAGRAATAMPKLQVMEILCAYPRNSYLFRYSLQNGKGTITWRTRTDTKLLVLKAGVIRWWNEATWMRTNEPLAIEERPLPDS
ncbi:hypothetical protein FDECE_13427 [Fusarium decemcellulare]|nr:hypothetical protein FDECE_13427 [Fusarium decemcellulare]